MLHVCRARGPVEGPVFAHATLALADPSVVVQSAVKAEEPTADEGV